MPDQRQRFENFQNWYDYLASKTDAEGNVKLSGDDLRNLRFSCYSNIEKLRKRPLIVYAANFLAKLPPDAPVSIDLQDIDGFTDLISSIDKKEKSVDVLIHSPGGTPDATERIVKLLRSRFEEVHFLVSHSAYSAATMMAMSGNTITLHQSAVLGPIDPQIGGIPARQIKRAFSNLQKKIIEEGEKSIIVYIPLIEKYDLHLLEMCDDSEKLSIKLVKEWIKTFMFNGERGHGSQATNAVKYMADFDKHLLHSMPLDIGRLKGYGIKVDYADDDLKPLLREAHILLDGLFNGGGFVKIYESPGRLSWGKRLQLIKA
jgi:hypothetical protein